MMLWDGRGTQTVAQHPYVIEAAVVAMPSQRWGTALAPFVALRRSAQLTSDELLAYLRAQIAGLKLPKREEFRELSKKSAGKIQNFALRDRLLDELKAPRGVL